MIEIEVNGETRVVPVGTTAASLLELVGVPARGVAIAVDGAVCPRRAWDTPLTEGATVDILTAVQGG